MIMDEQASALSCVSRRMLAAVQNDVELSVSNCARFSLVCGHLADKVARDSQGSEAGSNV
jgi:hypothetical protein